MKWILLSIISLSFSVGMAHETFAGWPTQMEIIQKVGPLAGIDPDGIEAAKFYTKNPECSSKIVSYTLAEDYSLAGFIYALKATKLSSLNKLGIPKMDLTSCKKLNAVERAYIFINEKGDQILGKSTADFLRKNLEEQIKNGKQELDAQIASIPYVGTILTNWDCGCDAAFQTNFQIEKLADKTVGLVVSIATDVSQKKIGSALEKLIQALGPKMACELGAEWTGVGKIPVVSTVASKACGSVAGKAVDFVIDGAGSIAESIGLIGGDYIPVDEYYRKMFTPDLAKDGYTELASILYGKCYNYFEPSNMSADTAKKVCSTLRNRYISESLGKLQFQKSSLEVYPYYKSDIEPAVKGAAMKGNKDFDAAMKAVDAICENYFSLRYPDQKAYEKTYDNPITPYSPEFCDYSYKIKDLRKSSQLALMNDIVNKTAPYCQASSTEKNVILCADAGLAKCQQSLPTACSPSSGNSEFPCCKGGGEIDSVFQSKMDYAKKLAKEIGGGYYCKTAPDNPLKISCGLESGYLSCQKKFQYESNKTCKKANTANGQYSDVCCDYDASILMSVPGVKDVQTFVDTENKKEAGSCKIGGELAGLSSDPRIVTCGAKSAPLCIEKFGTSCTPGGTGYVAGVCCEKSAFAGSEFVYDVTSRSATDIALAKKIVADSLGMCILGNTKKGVIDTFRIKCKTDASVGVCKEKIGERKAMTSCTKKETASGYVGDLCCEKIVAGISPTPQVNNPTNAGKDTPLPKKTPKTNKNTAKKTITQKKKPTVSGETRITP